MKMSWERRNFSDAHARFSSGQCLRDKVAKGIVKLATIALTFKIIGTFFSIMTNELTWSYERVGDLCVSSPTPPLIPDSSDCC